MFVPLFTIQSIPNGYKSSPAFLFWLKMWFYSVFYSSKNLEKKFSEKKLSSATLFNTDISDKCFSSKKNLYIRMISEGSCDTEE